jgi:hypothetical protein
MPLNADDSEPQDQAETREGQRAAGFGSYYRGVALRLGVVVFALAIAWIAPVKWPLKMEVYLGIMLAAVAAVIVFRASKRDRRISN